MSRACNICGGLILASNEVVGYSGPLCSGHRLGYTTQQIVQYTNPSIEAKLDKIIELLEAAPTHQEKHA